jgi:predicted 3-demethylubiquinone-9 3-methyltransferase (glyoxalase superfamily)
VPCDTQDDIDRYWQRADSRGEEGAVRLAQDALGVSWQIVPRNMSALLGGSDAGRRGASGDAGDARHAEARRRGARAGAGKARR